MLRITEIHTPGSVTLKLEGKLLAAWVDELKRAYEAASARGTIGLDLHDLLFVDAAGAAALGGLMRRGATLLSCSNFVSELLEEVRHA